jgi:gliding motility-associated protein GldC
LKIKSVFLPSKKLKMDQEKSAITKLEFNVHLDKDKMPEKIEWSSTSNGHSHQNKCKAMLIALWDGEANEALKIDLWTNDMRIDEMNLFYYQTLHTMADTLKKATGNEEAAINLKAFANMFGENTEVVKRIETPSN